LNVRTERPELLLILSTMRGDSERGREFCPNIREMSEKINIKVTYFHFFLEFFILFSYRDLKFKYPIFRRKYLWLK
jgi:hypothetical protein